MNILYYSEVDVICIVIMLLFKKHMRQRKDRLSTENRTFNQMMNVTVVMCFADMIAGMARGRFFTGARVVIAVSNMLYFEMISAVGFLWMTYVLLQLGVIKKYKRDVSILSIPFIMISAAIVTNPLTNFMFSIDEKNLYVRGVGVYAHWLFSWFYLIATTGIILYKGFKEQDKRRRKAIFPHLNFVVFPAIAAVMQSLFYGLNCTQVGITISIVSIALIEQRNQALTDSLTGLNNRLGFYNYVDHHLLRQDESGLLIMVIDVDHFKEVNDRYGHLEGDRVLAEIADAVRSGCYHTEYNLFVCRYGGDEFLIAGGKLGQDAIHAVKEQIHGQLDRKNASKHCPVLLSVSMGGAVGLCHNFNDVERLISVADRAMYEEKERHKRSMETTR